MRKDNKEKNRINFEKFKELQDQLGDMFSAIKSAEDTVELKDLDLKVVEKLRKASSDNLQLADKIEMRAGSNSRKPKLFTKEAFAWAGGSFITFATLAVAIIFIVPRLYNPIDDVANYQALPSVRLQPATITNSGYISPQSNFALETESVIQGDLSSAINVSPDVKFTTSRESKGNGELITVKIDEELVRGGEYTVSLAEGVRFADGSVLRKPIDWVFRVEPIFAVTGSTPRDKASSVPIDTAIEFEFNHKNLSAEELAKYVKISPDVSGRYEQYGMKIVFIPNDNLAVDSVYDVVVSGEFANNDGEKLGEDYKFSFQTGFHDSKGKYASYQKLSFGWMQKDIENITGSVASTFSAGETQYPLKVKLYSVPTADAVKHISEISRTVNSLPQNASQIDEKSVSYDTNSYTKDLSSKGFYILSATTKDGSQTIYRYFVKSDLGIVASLDGGSSGYIYNMISEKPIPGVNVDIYRAGKKISEAKSGEDGFFSSEAEGDLIVTNSGDNWAVYNSSLFNTELPMHLATYRYNYRGLGDKYSAYIVVDRPIYQPGDRVNFTLFVRDKSSATLAVPQNIKVNIVADELYYTGLNDISSGVRTLPIYEAELTVDSQFGTASGSFTIPNTQPQSFVNLSAYVEGTNIGNRSFDVSEFTKPEQKYEVAFEKAKYYVGEPVKATVSATDYSGQPLAGKQLKLILYKGNPSPQSMQNGYYDIYGYSTSQKADEKVVTLDKSGRYTYSFTPIRNDGGMNFTFYKIALSPVGSDYQVLSQASIAVSDYDYDIEMRTAEGYMVMDSGSKKDVELKFTSKSVWAGKPVGNKAFNIEVKREWTDWVDTGEEEYNEYTKRHEPKYIGQRHSEILSGYGERYTTDANGNKSITLKGLDRGSYTIKLRFDNAVKDYTYMFTLTDLEMEYRSSYTSSISIMANETSVEAGQKVRFKVSSSVGGSGVFLATSSTVDARSHLEIQPKGVVEFEVEAKDSMAPAIYACAYIITDPTLSDRSPEMGKGWSLSCTTVAVKTSSFDMNVKIESSKPSYAPGEEVVLDLLTTDSSGAPVKSSVSLAVVDQALLDLKPQDLFTYGINEHFKNAKRRIVFGVGNPRWDLLDGGMGAGGGGGEELSRENFPDTAFWNGQVVTGDDGRAQVKFTAPDSLTTWVVQAYGASTTNKYGYGKHLFTAKLDQFVVLDAPTFVRIGDNLTLGTEAANFGKSISGTLALSCDGCSEGGGEIKVDLPTGSRQSHEFAIKPADSANELRLRTSLKSGEQQLDAVKKSVPVFTDGIVANNIYSTILKKDATSSTIKFNLDSVRVDATKVDLVISKSFSIDSMRVEIDPGLNSTTQLANAILHDNFMIENYAELAPETPKDQLEKKVLFYLELMDSNQADNGGYGWFNYDAVSLESTAIAAEALAAAEELRPIPSSQRSLISAYLVKHIISENTSVQDKIMAFKALAMIDPATASVYATDLRKLFLESKEAQSDPLAIAMFMQGYTAIGSTGDTLWLSKYLEKLSKQSERGMYWDDIESNYKVMSSSDYVTSAVYLALAPLESWDIKVKVRNWLIDRSMSTYGADRNANAIIYSLAVADSENIFSFNNDNSFKLIVNGKELESFDLKGKDLSKVKVAIDSVYLKEGENELKITRSGKGELYISAIVKSVADSQPYSNGFTVTRELTELHSGKNISEVDLKVGDVVKVRIKSTPDADYSNVVVRDMIPSGMEPVRFNLQGVSLDTLKKFWQYNGKQVNRSGIAGKDYVSFGDTYVKAGEEQVYEYVVVVTNKGELSGGSTHVFLEMFPDISSYTTSEKIVID